MSCKGRRKFADRSYSPLLDKKHVVNNYLATILEMVGIGSCFILETRSLCSVNPLLNVGVGAQNILIPNPDPEECAAMLALNPELNIFTGTTHQYLDDMTRLETFVSQRGKLRLIFLDYTGIFGKKERKDISLLLSEQFIETDCVFALTFTSRGRKQFREDEFFHDAARFVEGLSLPIRWLSGQSYTSSCPMIFMAGVLRPLDNARVCKLKEFAKKKFPEFKSGNGFKVLSFSQKQEDTYADLLSRQALAIAKQFCSTGYVGPSNSYIGKTATKTFKEGGFDLVDLGAPRTWEVDQTCPEMVWIAGEKDLRLFRPPQEWINGPRADLERIILLQNKPKILFWNFPDSQLFNRYEHQTLHLFLEKIGGQMQGVFRYGGRCDMMWFVCISFDSDEIEIPWNLPFERISLGNPTCPKIHGLIHMISDLVVANFAGQSYLVTDSPSGCFANACIQSEKTVTPLVRNQYEQRLMKQKFGSLDVRLVSELDDLNQSLQPNVLVYWFENRYKESDSAFLADLLSRNNDEYCFGMRIEKQFMESSLESLRSKISQPALLLVSKSTTKSFWNVFLFYTSKSLTLTKRFLKPFSIVEW